MRSPDSVSYSRFVVRPARLLRMLIAVGLPAASRMISNTENGRRSRVSVISAGRTMTNWPAIVLAPTSGAARVSTL